MASENGGKRRRGRGHIRQLPNGNLQVIVYAGTDPVTGKRHNLTEIIPAGSTAATTAEKARVRLLNQVDERRNPRTGATVAQLLERYLDELRVGRKTLHTYRRMAELHILPFLGDYKIAAIDAEILDSLYAELFRCRDHCDRRTGHVDHRTSRAHDCDERCKPHTCRPLATWTVRKIHWILSGAYRKATRWRWIGENPMDLAELPELRPANPKPPTPEEAARLVNAAWTDPDWGTLVWLIMVTGMRRGELCGIRWRDLDLQSGTLHLERSIGQLGAELWNQDHTKSHRDRRIVLDPETVELLAEHRQRFEARAAALGVELSADAYVFSLNPDGNTPRKPGSVSSRYYRMAKRLGIRTSIHKLRHFSATELLLSGVDVRTVAGRLGHGGGGATTLRTYAAWVSEGDQRASQHIANRMPAQPNAEPPEVVEIEPKHPYERIAVALRDQILAGAIAARMPIPTIRQIASQHEVTIPTAKRAVDLLAEWGFVDVVSGRRTLVRPLSAPTAHADPVTQTNVNGSSRPEPTTSAAAVAEEALDLEVLRLGEPVTRFTTLGDPNDIPTLHGHLVAAIRRNRHSENDVGDYELVVRNAGERGVVSTYVAATT